MKIVCNTDTKRKEIIKLVNMMMIDREVKKIDIAHKTGQSEGTIRNLLNPNYRPANSITIDTLAMVCNAMDCDLVIDIVPRSKTE